MSDVDPRRCPLCGGANDCGIAAGASTCWCFTTEIPSDVRDRIPPEARDLSCVCRACAERQPSAERQLSAERQPGVTAATAAPTSASSAEQPPAAES